MINIIIKLDKFLIKKNIKINQKGGGNLIIEYKGENINFKKYKDDKNNIEIYLRTLDKKDNCIFITIDNNSKLAYINTINSSLGNCINSKIIDNKGSEYIKLSIKLLKKYKDVFKINKILLSDDSLFYCDVNTKINLTKLNFLQYNQSFYGRYGFNPVDKYDKNNYIYNQNKLNKIKTKNLNINKILLDYKYKVDSDLIIKINRKYIKYRGKKIYKWFNKISRIVSDRDCSLLRYLVDKIFIELKLYQVDNIFYELNI